MKQLSIIFLAISLLLSISVATAQDSLTLLAELWGEEDEDCFVICASAGDLNGDGYMDIAVGAIQEVYHKPGYVKIFFGNEEFDTIPDLKIFGEGEDPYGHYGGFGWSLACAGDVNHDGYDDLIVGAPYAFNCDNWAVDAGKAYIYLGGDPMDTTVDVILKDSDYNYLYGYSVSSAGDVNGDNYDDVIVGAHNDFIDGRGRACVYFGGDSMDNVLDVYIEGTAGESENLGTSMAGIGDLNGDGYDDILIGAPHTGGWPYPIGRASIYFGGDPMDTTADVTFHGDSVDFLNFGRGVCSAGDVNGDSIPDFVVSGTRKQKVFFGSNPQDTSTYLILSLGLAGEGQLSSGDINGDGLSDVLIRTNIFFGGIEMNSIADIVLANPDTSTSSKFARAVSFAGHMDGNEGMELLLSSYGGDSKKGVVFIFTSNPTFIDDVKQQIPYNFYLHQNYPNPFNSTTIIPFTVYRKRKTDNRPPHITLSIYNILGQRVKTMLDEMKSYGNHQVIWDGKDDSGETVPSGIYFCQLKIGDLTEVRKMIFLK